MGHGRGSFAKKRMVDMCCLIEVRWGRQCFRIFGVGTIF